MECMPGLYRKTVVVSSLLVFTFIPHVCLSYRSRQPPVRLSQFVSQVLATNPSIHSSQANIDAALANMDANSRPIYNPELEFEGQQVHKDEREDTYVAGISQTIDWANRRGARSNRSIDQLGVSEAQYVEHRLKLGVAALTALSNYRNQEKVVALTKQRTVLLKRFVFQTKRRFKAGDIAKDALNQANLAYAEAISQQAAAESILITERQHLTELTTIPSSKWPRLPAYLPRPKRVTSRYVVKTLSQLPDLLVMNALVSTAKSNVKVAKTETTPNPTLALGGGTEDKEALVRVTLNIPLFIRNNYKSYVVREDNKLLSVEEERQNVYMKAKANLYGTSRRYSILYDSYVRWQTASKSSLTGGVRLLDKLWVAGELNTTEYLVQLKQRLDSQLAGQELRKEAWAAWFDWLMATGNMDHWVKRNA